MMTAKRRLLDESLAAAIAMMAW